MTIKTKTIAFYLPQFHPIEENNIWWGRGFTEWTNVVKASPRFRGHHQPQLPADLGFYDLRVADTRKQQSDLAQEYGIYGFCYYHYWFNGKLLLETPLNQVLQSGEPDIPFCLCWANENWTRAWDGQEREVLISQNYTFDDSNEHIDWMLNLFKDPRYIKSNGRPVLLIYRPDSIPKEVNMPENWRQRTRDAGFPDLYLCAVRSGFVSLSNDQLLALGYDAIVDFQPNRQSFPREYSVTNLAFNFLRRFLPRMVYEYLKVNGSAVKRINYQRLVKNILSLPWPTNYRLFPCVFPSWDNTARRKTPTVIQNDCAELYGLWLKKSLENVSTYPEDEQLVFVNAWNEWAEGCHLEPDTKYGMSFLQVTREVLSGSNM